MICPSSRKRAPPHDNHQEFSKIIRGFQKSSGVFKNHQGFSKIIRAPPASGPLLMINYTALFAVFQALNLLLYAKRMS